jgi:cobalamin biosynthesis Mg chelatase CobN
MTSSSPYTNPRYPMAAATDVDFTLQDFIAEFPPKWNGLLQLRMYYGIPGKPTWTDTYAATDITVTGSTWRVVRGASVPCTKGSAKPNEPFRITPSPSSAGAGSTATATSTPSPVATSTPTPSATESVEPSADASGSGSPSPGSVAAGQVEVGSAAASWLLGLLALVALLGGGTWWYLRRQGESPSP